MSGAGKKSIGIIANPASGKDIRRVVAYGNAYGNSDKVSIVQRVLLAAGITGIDTVYYMEEYYGIVNAAVSGIYGVHRHLIEHLNIVSAENEMLGIERDTVLAAENMREMGARCLVTLGGDGTNRAVAKGCGDVPLVPISTGTNNVFPRMIEGTVAGMAAGVFASGRLGEDERYVMRSKRVDLMRNGEMFDMALIDAVVLDDESVASRAMWKTDSFLQLFLSSCSTASIGVSSIGGQLLHVDEREPRGLYVETSPDGQKLWVPLAPGLMEKVGINSYRAMEMGETIHIKTSIGVIAVDGERDISLDPENSYSAKLTLNGPRLLDIERILGDTREKRIFFERREA
jgi:hypothetical protein